jgi:predicted N-acetyltransferase YhbS
MAYLDTEKLFDVPEREALLDRVFGPTRFQKTCERLRESRLPAHNLAFVARAVDRVVGTLRFWHIDAGGKPALMLGPVAVDAPFRSEGLGGKLIRHGLEHARTLGYRGVILVGDAAYYTRFGFNPEAVAWLSLPGPVDAPRFLGLDLQVGGLAGARGLVRATGAIPLRAVEPVGDRRRAA